MVLSSWLLRPLQVQGLIGRIIRLGMTTKKQNSCLFLRQTNPSGKRLISNYVLFYGSQLSLVF